MTGSRVDGDRAVVACRVDEVPEDGCLAVADGRVLVARVDGHVVAWENRCQHRATPLDGGTVRDGVVTCPGHFWRYDLRTGRNLASGAPLAPVDVTVDDGRVVVAPPAPPPTSMRDLLREHARTWRRDGPPDRADTR